MFTYVLDFSLQPLQDLQISVGYVSAPAYSPVFQGLGFLKTLSKPAKENFWYISTCNLHK